VSALRPGCIGVWGCVGHWAIGLRKEEEKTQGQQISIKKYGDREIIKMKITCEKRRKMQTHRSKQTTVF